jgi:hypothetical protein
MAIASAYTASCDTSISPPAAISRRRDWAHSGAIRNDLVIARTVKGGTGDGGWAGLDLALGVP